MQAGKKAEGEGCSLLALGKRVPYFTITKLFKAEQARAIPSHSGNVQRALLLIQSQYMKDRNHLVLRQERCF